MQSVVHNKRIKGCCRYVCTVRIRTGIIRYLSKGRGGANYSWYAKVCSYICGFFFLILYTLEVSEVEKEFSALN